MASKKIDIYGGRDPREIPVYTYREAARCLNISPSTLKAWTAGQSNFSPILTSPAGGEQLSFFNLVEAWVVYDLRHRFHFSLQSLRKLFVELRRSFPDLSHPIAQADLAVLGSRGGQKVRRRRNSRLFAQHGDSPLLSLSQRDQLALDTVLRDLLERVEKTPASGIARLHPFITRNRKPDSPKTVVVDPTIAFGKPVIAGTGIPTAAIYQLFNGGDSIVDIAEDYDRTPQEIEDAIRYESVRSKAA